MKFFHGLLLATTLFGAFMTHRATADAGDIVMGFVAAEVGDSVSDSIKESRITQAMVCLPNDYPFSTTNLTSQCPSYVDAVAYQYIEPMSPFASFAGLCIFVLSITSCIHTCLFGSVDDKERMCDMCIGVFIHSLVRAMCDDDD